MDLTCFLCAEELSLNGGPHQALGLQCCGQTVCQTCLYRHIQSVWEEGLTGQGRTVLLCPMGCAHELTDKMVRSTVTRQHPLGIIQTLLWRVVWNILIIATWLFWNCPPSHSSWLNCAYSRSAQLDFAKGERWSLAVALRRIDGVQCCPAPDCGYLWLANPSYRRHKLDHERKGSYLWYTPPRPERVPYTWVEPEYLDMSSAFIEQDTRDGRRMVCPKCHIMFCGLCKHPWELSRSKSHAKRSCEAFARKYSHLLQDTDFAFVGQLLDCRSCPGCSLRTNRTAGCNHMTCPCGTEWCYVCEGRWNPWHHQCVERPRGGAAGSCTIM